MKVSVIISTYNSPTYLKKVLESFRFQIRPPDEIVVADDGSGQDTGEVIQNASACGNFPLLHVWQENQGFRAGKIRNAGIARSSGEYIILLDGDCVVGRHFVSDHLALAQKGYFIQGKRILVSKEAMANFDCYHANSSQSLWKMALQGRLSNIHHLIRLPFVIASRNKKLAGIKSCNMSFFKDDVIAINGFNEDYIGWGNEDSDLACRLIKYGLAKKISPFMAICFHLWHPTNKTVGDLNRDLLENAIRSDTYVCKNGIVKKS